MTQRAAFALLLAALLARPLAADEEPPFAVESASFVDSAGQGSIAGRVSTRLPDGGLLHVSLQYGGYTIPPFRKRFRIQGGAVEFALGPTTSHVLSGTYRLVVQFDLEAQPRAYWKILEKAGVTVQANVEVEADIVVRTPQLPPEERARIDEHYAAIHDGTSVLLDEAMRFRDAAEEEFDAEACARWKAGLSGRIAELGTRYEHLLDAYLVLPEQALCLSMGAIFQHLAIIVNDMVASRGRPKPTESEETAGAELTTEDRIYHVRQVLRGLALHLGRAGTTDAQVVAELKKQLLAVLDEFVARAPEADEAARQAWFDEWSPRASTIGQGLVLAESSGDLLVEFRRLRRDVVAAGDRWRAGGEPEDLAELRTRLGAEADGG